MAKNDEVEELTPAQIELQKQLLTEFMSEQLFPAPHHFAARAEIYRLRDEVLKLRAQAKKGSSAPEAGKPQKVKNGGDK